MAATVVLTARALADLHDVEDYTVRTWGRKTSEKYLDEISSALERLQMHPDILRSEPALASDLFFYRVKKHWLVCDFHGEIVTVLTVLHTSMDLPMRLAELELRLADEADFLHEKLRKKLAEQPHR